MILDEKVFSPPPPNTKAPSPPSSGAWRTLSAFPPHLLQIVHATFYEAYDIKDPKEQLACGRPAACQSRVLSHLDERPASIYLPLYDSLIRPLYTSDLFPFAHSHASSLPSYAQKSPSPSQTEITSLQRKMDILDLFIALKDHVREYGVAESVLAVDLRANGEREGPTSVVLRSAASYAVLTQRIAARTSSSSSSGSSFWRSLGGKGKARAPAPPTPVPSQKVTIHPLPFSAISASFSSRRVGLVLMSSGGGGGSGWLSPGGSSGSKRTIVEVARTRDEALEVAARRLMWELRDWLLDGVDGV
ncbi:hypothetical protein K438DRAFT_2013118 [Mycena galopus ATCC 62051]|nr:hypothetical protein K438DRAFT_2013118 [Mycena galopus ATCC 62051]